MDSEPKIPFYTKASQILLVVIIVIFLLYYGQAIIIPLIFALFIAILLNPFVNFLVRRKFNRLLAIAIVLILTLLLIAGLVALLSFQLSKFSETYPQLKVKLNQVTVDTITWIAAKFNMKTAEITKWLNGEEKEMLRNAAGNIAQTLLTVGNALLVMVLLPVYTFLILYYKPLLLEFISELFDATYHKPMVEVLNSVKQIIQSYLTGLVIEGAIVAVLNCIGLFILGIDYAILLGITGAILNVIPYIGGIIAIALPMVIALVTKSVVSSLLVLLVYTIIQFIDNHYLIPYIVASKVKLNALIAIIVILIGYVMWGIPGMFLSIPLTALIKVIFDHIPKLKPWGFVLGDNMPTTARFPFFTNRK